jgi:hypothetical protein
MRLKQVKVSQKRKAQGGGEKGEEMTQTLYAHMNKIEIFKKRKEKPKTR